ncbi:MAG: hypothetical protein K0M67_20890 [Thiobacillus sp.]|nr:hypothetical protein [Thiobacillus sp.]
MNAFRNHSFARQGVLHLLMLSLLLGLLLGHSWRTASPTAGDALAQAMAASICSTGNGLQAGDEAPGETQKRCLGLCAGCCAMAPVWSAVSLFPCEAARTQDNLAHREPVPSTSPSLRLPLPRAPPISV